MSDVVNLSVHDSTFRVLNKNVHKIRLNINHSSIATHQRKGQEER